MFTHNDMPFSLSNIGCSCCYLTEQYLGDQQFVTLLLYIDDICIFVPSIDIMLDYIKLVMHDIGISLKTQRHPDYVLLQTDLHSKPFILNKEQLFRMYSECFKAIGKFRIMNTTII